MENLIVTEQPKNYSGSVVPAINNGAVVTDDTGHFLTSQTLPTAVQKNIEAENLKFKDSTANNSSETKHGFLPKLSGVASNFLNGLGRWVNPPREGYGFGNIWKVDADQVVTISENYENVVSSMQVDGVLIIEGKLTIL